eukprot:1688049-Pleurochrysis_carterae.AAC.1
MTIARLAQTRTRGRDVSTPACLVNGAADVADPGASAETVRRRRGEQPRIELQTQQCDRSTDGAGED